MIAATVDPDPCPACTEPANRGLCHSERCRSQVLPQLRETSLKRDTHSGKYFEPTSPKTTSTPTNASEHATRMARQSERHLARLGRSAAGQFTRTRRRTGAR
jgi:hypothetical protein